MKLLETLTHLVPAPAAKATCPKSEPTLLQRGSDAIRDLFIPGQQGEKARIHSQYQLCKKLGVHQSRDAQSYSQDAISQTGRAVIQVRNTVSKTVHGVSAGTQEALTVAKDFWADEAHTAKGIYRVGVGAAQGTQITLQGLYSTGKFVAKLGLYSAETTHHGLKGDINFKDAACKGGEKALRLVERGANYAASGRLLSDGKKFAKGVADYSCEYASKVKNDPGLEVPKLLAIVAGIAATGGGMRALGTAGKVGGVLETAAGTQAPAALAEGVAVEGLAASQAAPAVAAEEALASQAAPVLEEAAACAPQPAGTIVSPGFAQRQATGSWQAATSKPAVGNITPPGYAQRGAAALEKTTEYTPRSAPPAAPVRVAPPAPAAPAAPVASAPVELGPSTLPLPTKTTFCLPSNNYAPVPRTYMKLSEPLESIFDIKG